MVITHTPPQARTSNLLHTPPLPPHCSQHNRTERWFRKRTDTCGVRGAGVFGPVQVVQRRRGKRQRRNVPMMKPMKKLGPQIDSYCLDV
jgi:hypothetical protein